MKELKTVAKGGIYSLTGDVSSYIFRYLYLLIASNLLGPAVLGAYYWCAAITNSLIGIASFGMVGAITYFAPKFEAERGENGSLSLINFIIRFGAMSGIVWGLLLFIFAPQIATFLNKPNLVLMLRLFAIAIPARILWRFVYRYLLARFKFKISVVIEDLLRPFFRICLLLLFIVIGFRFYSMVFVDITASFLIMIIGFVIINKIFGFHGKTEAIDADWKKKVLVYSAPFIPLHILRQKALIVIILGFYVKAAKIGIFSVCFSLAMISIFLLTGIGVAFTPLLSKLFAENNLNTLQATYKSVTRWVFIGTLPIFYLLIAYPRSFLMLFGERYEAGWTALIIFAAGFLFDFGTSFTQNVITMSGRSWWILFNQIIVVIFAGAAALVLIPHYQIIGGALAFTASIILLNILRLYQSYKIIRCLPFSIYLLKPIVSVVIAGALIHSIYPIGEIFSLFDIILLGVLFVAFYTGIVVLMGINKEDKMLLFAAKDKLLRSFSYQGSGD